MLTCMSMIGMNLCFNEPWGRESIQDQYLTFIYCICAIKNHLSYYKPNLIKKKFISWYTNWRKLQEILPPLVKMAL